MVSPVFSTNYSHDLPLSLIVFYKSYLQVNRSFGGFTFLLKLNRTPFLIKFITERLVKLNVCYRFVP
ncbi:hypothetical protein B4Q04_15235 [Zobellia sp. OII3]|nr:hypothetical protein B4Q04_15235 [Zobellia sp. OII3]